MKKVLQTTPVAQTPMMQQWMKAKQEYPTAILFFRSGDFFEVFNDDAPVAASELNISLTKRKIAGSEYPMCGVPHHSADKYAAKLVEKGYTIVYVDQIEDARFAKGLVKRAVTRVVTRGTLVFDEAIESGKNVFTASVFKDSSAIALASADITTGELRLLNYSLNSNEELMDELIRIQPEEILCNSSILAFLQTKFSGQPVTITLLEDSFFSKEESIEIFKEHFNVTSLESFGVQYGPAIASAGAIFKYFRKNLIPNLKNFTSIDIASRSSEHVELDSTTIRSLELLRNTLHSSTEYTLFRTLDLNKSSAGRRLLQQWIVRPVRDKEILETRLSIVSTFIDFFIEREELREILENMVDLQRLAGRIVQKRVTPRDLGSLRDTLFKLGEIKKILQKALIGLGDQSNLQHCTPFDKLDLSLFNNDELHEKDENWRSLEEENVIQHTLRNPDNLIKAPIASKHLQSLTERIHDLNQVISILHRMLVDEPSNSSRYIRQGINEELDDLREKKDHAERWLKQYLERESRRTGIKNLKTGYNRTFGYYLEVSKGQTANVPPEFEPRQTLVNAQRYITSELKEFESDVLRATERIEELEKKLFDELIDLIIPFLPLIQESAHSCAQLDVFLAFSIAAIKYNYVAPHFNDQGIMRIWGGRHPVVERNIDFGTFVPNGLYMSKTKEGKIHLITGPNMGGKSTFLRQIALIQLMAQIGSFIPASFADLPLVDRISTRIGASDAISQGQSTFYREMLETSHILRSATENSLILLDEIGRGTSTFDGVAIAWSIIESLDSQTKGTPFTLFASHYHQLLELEKHSPKIVNYHLAVENETFTSYASKQEGQDKQSNVKKEKSNNSLNFTYSIKKGGTDKSYGIQVAALAGLPKTVVDRAQQILHEYESYFQDFLGVSENDSDTDTVEKIETPRSHHSNREAKLMDFLKKK